ncbi:helix-turn-helix transcriptional regulator [Marinobacter zhejiangensis]|uniref:Predicted DNA-binding transcriptional regulator YafY, contains an HTH and WYL domains n=1 Tax=Marinobacter zhejiangensis TaxID=488535 RepID=A0A1I4N5V1_9GAMM|nr:YafY family protein [Marinobacter zhejiangensis]SFM10879.1 Predicted DNA-binding transcriptional regulator YafY, contains an HTH and WYL domains [Marinobacter zhejiangensis]
MSRFDRIYRIHELLRGARHPVSMKRFMEELEASRNTITRDFEYLRDSLGAPLEYCRENNGHRYNPAAPLFELPGFWMSSGELYALLACEQLLEDVQPGLMAQRLAPLKERIRSLLGESGHGAERIGERIQVQPIQARMAVQQVFDPVAEATLAGKQLQFDYAPRSRATHSFRTVHPQRLLHYRSNWFLLAQCESANDLRLFSLDRITRPQVLDAPAAHQAAEELDAYTSSSFGIFGGQPQATAHFRFTQHAAQWVAEEQWHRDQKGEWHEDGFHLHVPYSDPRELVMDILRYGPEVEVIGPETLRGEVAERVRKMVEIYD